MEYRRLVGGQMSSTKKLPQIIMTERRVCKNCNKKKMCWFWRAVQDIEEKNMRGAKKTQLPIKVERLAEICEEYEEVKTTT